jgi:pyruvate/2-oxoglutarate dehydrogenase complex dihydrolipoamide acyltransferase (E2) component
VVKQIHFKNDTICAVGHPIMTIETDDTLKTPASSSSSSSDESSEETDSDGKSGEKRTLSSKSLFSQSSTADVQ